MAQEEQATHSRQEDRIQLAPAIFIACTVVGVGVGMALSSLSSLDSTVECALGGACVGLLIIVRLLLEENNALRKENADLKRGIHTLADASQTMRRFIH